MNITCLYRLESHLVESFKYLLETKKILVDNSLIQDYANEYDYKNGRVDIVSKSKYNELIAFEAKLYDWKKAMNQAYRNTSFAHYSFVLLPFDTALKALAWETEFKKRNVGIYSLKKEEPIILLHPDKKTPIQPWLTKRAIQFINTINHESFTQSCSICRESL